MALRLNPGETRDYTCRITATNNEKELKALRDAFTDL